MEFGIKTFLFQLCKPQQALRVALLKRQNNPAKEIKDVQLPRRLEINANKHLQLTKNLT